MSWITQAQLRRDTPQARQLVSQLLMSGNRDAGHSLVWNLFAEDPDAPRDFLYREAEPGQFLIVSHRAPKDVAELWALQSRPYAPQIATHERFGFSLRANPTVSLSQPDRARSQRKDVMEVATHRKGSALSAEEREAAAMDWLLGRASQLGVWFDTGLCGTRRRDRLRLSKGIVHTVVDYEGVLIVEDPARLLAALIGGVGRGKAYGLGLLLLRRLGS
jgi:CRISPR system Cascade subunit CasE